ncbi:50S ribosome-binding GTPase [Lusitaniella coriacea LEGE 07157]|uniref:50S ribosome-binding GTPase n=1 Tax=Lusitaniella coriacea LEGE 07157 TaxID=945747 RepID=A0A8J7DX67_9CYAN|nr:GTPase [Lusitaniella coriacea]MBE9116901.1 50S ribosome-binding GTPase [Lusitaniella coriacea LEGE 07157]
MAKFFYKDRQYEVSVSPESNEQEILILTNSDGVELTIREGEKKAVKRDSQDNLEEVDLQTAQYKNFYDSLIQEARKVVKKDSQDKVKSFFKALEVQYEERVQDFHQTLNIVVIGNVSSGKSSLINALLRRTRQNALMKVGVQAGVTTKLNILRLDEKVRLIDSPGLGDVRAENSEITQEFLKSIDVGILVVTGAVDASQKEYFNDLKENCKSFFVVLNKRDEWDRYHPQALENVMNQWKEYLKIDKIYPVCTFGYDSQLSDNTPLDIRGVIQLREDIEDFLESQGKKLLLARHMSKKRSYAKKIVVGAVTAVGIQAALPGKALFITTTQVIAIGSLYYLYTGQILSKGSALALLPVFAGQAVATNVFLFFTSFIPPTGIVEIAAAITAISITAAMLASINFVLSSGAELTDEKMLKLKFREYREQVQIILKNLALTDITKIGSLNFTDIVDKLI